MQSLNRIWSISLCRVAGYGLLIVAFLNLLDVFIPTYFTDPNWKFNTVGTLIERMPLALIGTVLVFFAGGDHRKRWEKLPLKIISWSTLVVGVLFLMLIPLVVKAAMEIDTQNTIQINAQYSQQMIQLEQVQAQINRSSEQQVNSMITVLKNQNSALNINSSSELKRQVTTEVDQARKAALETSKSSQISQRLNLRKSVIKWSLTALVSAFLFFSVWHTTRWVRQSNGAWAMA
jgi:hypothetical protein